jgi:hypothetical protein
MSDQPPHNDPAEDPTRMFDPSRPEEKLPLPERMPRRGYEGQRRMSPPPPAAAPNYAPPPSSPPAAPPPGPSRYGAAGQRPVEAAPVRIPPPPRSKKDSGLYLPWWSLLVLILVVGGGAVLLLMFVLNAGENFVLGDQTPQVIVVTNALTGNTVGQPSNTTNVQPPVTTPGGVAPSAQPINTTVPTAAPTETNIPGVTTGCPIGAVVEVVGTAPTGLSIRSEPQQGQNILSVAPDGEQFTIVAGPQTSVAVDGTSLEFCQVEGITNTNRQGWAARQYLAEVN